MRMIQPKRLTNSFKFACDGFCSLIKREQNFRIHVLISLAAVVLGLYFKILIWQWCLIILLIMIVLILEVINTVFERLTYLLKPSWHEAVKEIKDCMSAGVLVAAIASALIGLLIFVPYFLRLN